MDTLENLRTKSQAAIDLKSVVKSMKAMAASNITQYQAAANSLGDYYRTVALGILAYLKAEKIDSIVEKKVFGKSRGKMVCAIVFGSDQGLVGHFNESISELVSGFLNNVTGKKEIWGVGERVQLLLSDEGYSVTNLFSVPNAVTAITSLVNEILEKTEERQENPDTWEFYIFHNQPKPDSGYHPVMQKFLPLDEKWKNSIEELPWPSKITPEVAGSPKPTLLALVSEYLFVSLYKACAESLAAENASRLEAMQRAEKNIEEILTDLGARIQRLRQSTIDEELFDVIAGFEAIIRQRK